MNRPDEIAALADELENFEEVVLRTDDGPEWSDKRSLSDDEKEMVVTALRLSATSPSDAVREDQSKIGMLLLDYANGHACDDKEFARSAGSRLVNGAATAARSAADPLDDLVARFATALLAKLKDAREKYGYADEGWQYDDWRLSCREQLLKHLAKGDPRDVAAYCAFMWHHGWKTVAALAPAEKAGNEFTRSFDTRGTTMRRRCNIFEITCETGEIANRVADQLRSPSVALAPAEKARDELKVACASCKKIPGPHCQRPTCAFRDYIDTRTVKTVLAMTSSELSVIPASAVESGREMARQAIAATPTPPRADVEDETKCECGFLASACRTNPCYRKKTATSGLVPNAKYPDLGHLPATRAVSEIDAELLDTKNKIIALIREGFDPEPNDWPRHRGWDDGAGEIAEKIIAVFQHSGGETTQTVETCPRCNLKADSLLHKFCTHSQCPIRSSLIQSAAQGGGTEGGEA